MAEVTASSSQSDHCRVKEETVNGIRKNGVWIKLLLLMFLIGFTIVLYHSNFFKFFFCKSQILAFLDSLGPLAFAGFILLQAAQVVLAPIPGEVTGLIGGFLYGPMLGVALSTLGLVIGSILAFFLARSFGRPFIEKFIDRSVLERFDYLLHHNGLFLIFVLFLIPGFPKDYLCFILGLGRLTLFEFIVVSSVGRFFGTVLLTLSGGYIRYQQYGRLSILIALAAILAVLVYLFRERLDQCFRLWHARQHCKKSIGRSDSII